MEKLCRNKIRIFVGFEVLFYLFAFLVINFVLKRCGSVDYIAEVLELSGLYSLILFKSDILIAVILLINYFFKNKVVNYISLCLSLMSKITQLYLIYKVESVFIQELFSSLECNYLLIMTVSISLMVLILNCCYVHRRCEA